MERIENGRLRVWSSPVGHISKEYGGCEKPQSEPRKRKPIKQVVPTLTILEVDSVKGMPANGSIEYPTQAVQETFI